MQFLIADTFTSSLAKLTGDEQKAVKTTAFDLQLNPANPGMSFHKLDKARDKNFWSVRVSSDLRLIIHRTESSLLLCYVDHHDKAYDWAERRKLDVHPKTGAAQLIEIRESIQQVIMPRYVESEQVMPQKPVLFSGISEDELLGYGVPSDWLADVRQVDEDGLLNLVDHLPAEAVEALFELATGGRPAQPTVFNRSTDPFAHPDALRRFRVMNDVDELAQALDSPWEKWIVFLHPSQVEWVERSYTGPARISGSAGTGKTVVALHRAVFLAKKHPDARILLTTFSETLANMLREKLRLLISHEPQLAERLEVHSLNAIGKRLYEQQMGRVEIASADLIQKIIADAASTVPDHQFAQGFLLSEWREVVDEWQISSWEEYRDVKRLGRKTRLPESKRRDLWQIFERAKSKLKAQKHITYAHLFTELAHHLSGRKHPPFDFAVVDEAQDLSVSQLKFLATLGSQQQEGLFFAGDLGQRIFQQPFSWKSLGIDIRGRSRTLHINYRTSHQIRAQADRLLETQVTDVDGNIDERAGTISVFNGPVPIIEKSKDSISKIEFVSNWLGVLMAKQIPPKEIGVFVRSNAEINRAQAAVEKSGLPFQILSEDDATNHQSVSISTMHMAKGLEFRAVVVMACDDEVIPLQSRIETATENSELEEIYNTERQLLYVACTRAREQLLVSSGGWPSEFLDDLI